MPEPRFAEAQQLLRKTLIVLSTDRDEHDNAAENAIWGTSSMSMSGWRPAQGWNS